MEIKLTHIYFFWTLISLNHLSIAREIPTKYLSCFPKLTWQVNQNQILVGKRRCYCLEYDHQLIDLGLPKSEFLPEFTHHILAKNLNSEQEKLFNCSTNFTAQNWIKIKPKFSWSEFNLQEVCEQQTDGSSSLEVPSLVVTTRNCVRIYSSESNMDVDLDKFRKVFTFYDRQGHGCVSEMNAVGEMINFWKVENCPSISNVIKMENTTQVTQTPRLTDQTDHTLEITTPKLTTASEPTTTTPFYNFTKNYQKFLQDQQAQKNFCMQKLGYQFINGRCRKNHCYCRFGVASKICYEHGTENCQSCFEFYSLAWANEKVYNGVGFEKYLNFGVSVQAFVKFLIFCEFWEYF